MKELLEQLKTYTTIDNTEGIIKARFIDFVNTNHDCFERSLLIGHITASGFIYDERTQKILLIHHKKLDKWLQPGGHCDGDKDTLGVAIKEVFEETGVMIENIGQSIFDLDIHTIPERKDIPEHEHFDVRYLFFADSTKPLVQNHETNQLMWIRIADLEKYTTEESLLRMKRKVLSLEY